MKAKWITPNVDFEFFAANNAVAGDCDYVDGTIDFNCLQGNRTDGLDNVLSEQIEGTSCSTRAGWAQGAQSATAFYMQSNPKGQDLGEYFEWASNDNNTITVKDDYTAAGFLYYCTCHKTQTTTGTTAGWNHNTTEKSLMHYGQTNGAHVMVLGLISVPSNVTVGSY